MKKLSSEKNKAISQILGINDTKNIEFEGDKAQNKNMFNIIKHSGHTVINKHTNLLNTDFLQDVQFLSNAGWENHTIGMAFYQNYLLYTNTGQGSNINNSKSGTYIIPVTEAEKNMLESILNNNNMTYSDTIHLLREKCSNTYNIITGNTNTKDYIQIEQKPQKRGNCTKSNRTKIWHGLVVISSAKKLDLSDSIQDLKNHFATNKLNIKNIYKKISDKTRKESLRELINNLDKTETAYESKLLATEYILQHKNSKKPFFKLACKAILLKLLKIEEYTTSDGKHLSDINIDSKLINDIQSFDNSSSKSYFLHHHIANILNLKNTINYNNFDPEYKTPDKQSQIEQLNITDSNGDSPLHIALKKGHNEKVYLFVKAIFNNEQQDSLLNAKNNDRLSPLKQQENNTNIFEILLNDNMINNDISLFKKLADYIYTNKINVNTFNTSKLFHLAIKTKQIDIITYLLDKGLDPNIQDDRGNTPLHIATREESLEFISILINNGADPDIKDNQGNSPLHEATLQGNTSSISFLINNRADPNIQDIQGSTPLHIAAFNKDDTSISALLDNKADPNIQDNQGCSPLHIAAFNQDTQSISALINKNANPNIQDNQGNFPLNIKNRNGCTPLHTALKQGDNESVYFLVKAIFDNNQQDLLLNAKNNQNVSPLEQHENNIFEILLNYTKIKKDTLLFKKVLDYIYTNKIEVNNFNASKLLYIAIKTKQIDIANYLLDKNVDPNIQNARGNTPLHIAAAQSNDSLILSLLNKGANSNIKNIDGVSPLHITIIKENHESTHNLLSHNTNPNIQDNQGNSPLHIAVYKKDITSISTLLNNNANPNIQDNQGNSPLHIAVRKQNNQAISALLNKGANSNIENNKGQTPLKLAIDQNDSKSTFDLLPQSLSNATYNLANSCRSMFSSFFTNKNTIKPKNTLTNTQSIPSTSFYNSRRHCDTKTPSASKKTTLPIKDTKGNNAPTI